VVSSSKVDASEKNWVFSWTFLPLKMRPLHCNNGNQLPSIVVQYPRRIATVATLLQRPENSNPENIPYIVMSLICHV